MADSGHLDELQRKFDENPRRYFAPLANEFRKAGDPERAITLCQAYLSQQPGHMSGYIVYGQALFDTGQRNEAASAFEQALTLDPENMIAMRYLGDIARDTGDVERAAGWYRKLLDLDPKDEVLTASLAQLTTAPPAGEVAPPVPAEPSVGEEQATDVPPDVSPLEEAFPVDAVIPAEVQAELPPDEAAVAWGDVAAVPVDAQQLPVITEFAPEEVDEDSGSVPDGVHAPFVTETMATLYLQQGFTAKALGVYQQLATLHPEPRLQEKVRELEHAVAAEAVSVRDFFARIGARRPATVVVPPAPSPADTGGIAALFAGAPIEAHDERAAAALAGAYALPQ